METEHTKSRGKIVLQDLALMPHNLSQNVRRRQTEKKKNLPTTRIEATQSVLPRRAHLGSERLKKEIKKKTLCVANPSQLKRIKLRALPTAMRNVKASNSVFFQLRFCSCCTREKLSSSRKREVIIKIINLEREAIFHYCVCTCELSRQAVY